jgi:ketosteroid isomerase-like protein
VRAAGKFSAGAALAVLALAACSNFRREERVEPPPPDPGSIAAVNAEARRIFQTRAYERLKAEAVEVETAAIRDLLSRQVGAWNRGDLDAFMASYWRSPDLRFASGSTPVRGWAEALRRYRNSYPDRDDMGALTLSDLEIEILSPDAASAFGRWRLAQASETPTGLFTLVLRKIEGRWYIVHDHTTSGV